MSDKQLRLTGTSYAVISLLELLGEATPYDLKQALEHSVENFWPVPHTTFYAEPDRLTNAGLLSERREQHGRRRKLYSVTERGREALHAWRDSPELAPPQLRDEGVLKLFAGGDPVAYSRSRRAFYRAKLEELESYLAGCPDDERFRGARASLIAGITYNRLLLEATESFLAEQRVGADS
ncbi:MAG TPA: PadR family transcriptional regulator [Solirubrobacteraceae bacterium]|jgi:PadR family transcriptional regulator AphA|nr:PadR family transcriptional regulator [Solirubrobacteraceae bacterium]